jgi:hypothetical protein
MLWEFAVTVPAATPPSALLVTDTPIGPGITDRVSYHIPPGALGLVGFRFTMGKTPVIPSNPAAFIIRNGHTDGIALEGLPDSGAWQVAAYNNGVNPHTIYVTYVNHRIQRPVTLLTPFTFDQLAEVPDLSHAGAPIGGR